MSRQSPIFVLSTSAATAERHAALDPDVWFATEADARAWLSCWQSDIADMFDVYRVTRLDTCDRRIWTAVKVLDREEFEAAA